MTQSIQFEQNEDGDFQVLLDGESAGVVEEDGLREEVQRLDAYFKMEAVRNASDDQVKNAIDNLRN